LAFTLASNLLWGAQPIAIAIVIKVLSPMTLSYYKLASAALMLGIYLVVRKKVPNFSLGGMRPLGLLITASAALALSYFLFNSAFVYISPSNTQLYFQSSRVFLAVSGVFIFKEFFNLRQWFSLSALVLGLVLFFHNQFYSGVDPANYALGVIMVLSSAFLWTVYAVIQKSLFKYFSAPQILLFIYVLSSVLLVHYADWSPTANLRAYQWLALIFICVSNLLAFAFFAEALAHWEASKVSAISCLTPLITIILMSLISPFFSEMMPESLDWTALSGAVLVIFGSVFVIFPNPRQVA
jgi:drug/metabolite transporter (DMT)-like permease